MRKVITGDQVAQIRNPDPFAPPVWRRRIPHAGWIIAIAQLGRFVFWLHPDGGRHRSCRWSRRLPGPCGRKPAGSA